MKIRSLLVLICLLSTGPMVAQLQYNGVLKDASTLKPLAYVNIGIISKGIGTVSDEEGVFYLPLQMDDFTPKDTLQFSSLGYRTIKKAVTDLQFVSNEYPIILMQPQATKLKEVILTNANGYELYELVGYQNYGENIFGYWKDNIALGGELATKIKVKKGLRRLNYLFFEVKSNPSDSVLIRVNIYNTDGNQQRPESNLNTSNRNILYTIRSDTKIVTVDLAPFEIYVRNDFYVSLELLKVYGEKEIALVLLATQNTYTYSYRKFSSLADWERIPDAAMAYHLNTTYYSPKKQRNTKVVKNTKNVNRKISGFVFFSGNGLSNAKITNYSNNVSATTDENGRYSILGSQGDVLEVEAPGMKKRILKLPDKNTMNITMEPK